MHNKKNQQKIHTHTLLIFPIKKKKASLHFQVIFSFFLFKILFLFSGMFFFRGGLQELGWPLSSSSTPKDQATSDHANHQEHVQDHSLLILLRSPSAASLRAVRWGWCPQHTRQRSRAARSRPAACGCFSPAPPWCWALCRSSPHPAWSPPLLFHCHQCQMAGMPARALV